MSFGTPVKSDTVLHNSIRILLQNFHLLYRARNQQICRYLRRLLLHLFAKGISYMFSSFSALNGLEGVFFSAQQQLLNGLLRMISELVVSLPYGICERKVTKSLQGGKPRNAQKFIRSLI